VAEAREEDVCPRRPILFPEQFWLVLLTAVVLVGSIVVVILVLRA
jgi:hypothetical protein